MSTIDPVAARLERERRKPGVVRIAVVLLLEFIAGAAMGYGWPTLFAGGADADPSVLSVVTAAVGLPLGIISGMLWGFIVVKRRELGLFYGFAAFWFGAGLGLLLTAGILGPALSIALGIAAIAVALFFLTTGTLAGRKRGAAARRAADIMASTPSVKATVSEKGYVLFSESTRILTTVTFTFTDADGTQRWVQRPMLVRAESPIENGQQTELWYDRTDPGNDSKIVVRLAIESPPR